MHQCILFFSWLGWGNNLKTCINLLHLLKFYLILDEVWFCNCSPHTKPKKIKNSRTSVFYFAGTHAFWMLHSIYSDYILFNLKHSLNSEDTETCSCNANSPLPQHHNTSAVINNKDLCWAPLCISTKPSKQKNFSCCVKNMLVNFPLKLPKVLYKMVQSLAAVTSGTQYIKSGFKGCCRKSSSRFISHNLLVCPENGFAKPSLLIQAPAVDSL